MLSKFPATSVGHYVDQFREALVTIGALQRSKLSSDDIDALKAECGSLRAQLAELPAYMAALEKYQADDGEFVRLADVHAALSACAGRTEATGYRLLAPGETMQADDQFLGMTLQHGASWPTAPFLLACIINAGCYPCAG
ncbi:hypothetical protein KMZ27_27380 [Pseudomonas shirazica]|nr:hypothetical protein [Pseudomonas shirazica]